MASNTSDAFRDLKRRIDAAHQKITGSREMPLAVYAGARADFKPGQYEEQNRKAREFLQAKVLGNK